MLRTLLKSLQFRRQIQTF